VIEANGKRLASPHAWSPGRAAEMRIQSSRVLACTWEVRSPTRPCYYTIPVRNCKTRL
jgi:hypothetical protein